ncbi:MAG: DmsE family decaheme c-type cytochrome [Pyrinomonadaceae bacterium]
MTSSKYVKVSVLCSFSLLLFAWMVWGSMSTVAGISTADELTGPELAAATGSPDDYVGSETCKACHEDQFNAFSKTKHAQLAELKSWKDKAKGCESCHGPGSKHVEDPTVKGSIISFAKKDTKAASETCLACHSGKEQHNNFRRGEHWRNNVGCTDCHSSHGSGHNDLTAESITFVGGIAGDRPNEGTTAMLKQSEPQLCLSCHNETRSQFTKPFHHKVLEGTMKCSDCHNAHGGFEQKQTRLAVGNDAGCVKCHANKAGPFVFEHAPLKVEGCSACHTPHGSANAKLLKRAQVRQLCFECHTGISEELGPQAPSLHNQAQVRYQQCTVCHSAIHGSNYSSYFAR